MNIWSLLGIEQTKDKELIKNAYREHLMKVNPEDDPEGFQQLRQAYEEALKYADRTEEEGPQFDDSPVGLFMQEVDQVYHDFSRRIDTSVWEDLFSRDVAVALDSKELVCEKLLAYFMEHHLVPHNVWKVVVENFLIEEQKNELTEKFPKDFLEYIINNARYDDTLSYYLFEEKEGDLPYDEYIRTFLAANGMLQRRETEKVEPLFDKLRDLGLTHPQGLIAHVRFLLQKGELEIAKLEAEDILQEYEDLPVTCMMMAEICWQAEEYGDALTWYERILEKEPSHYGARCGVAECYMHEGNYAKAKKRFKELLNDNRFDNYIHKCMMDCNAQLISVYREKLEQNPEDYESLIELIWCYYQNYDFDQAYEVLVNAHVPNNAYLMDYDYLYGRVALQKEDKETALKFFEKWLEDYPVHKDDADVDPEVLRRNDDRQGLTNFFIAEVYSDMAQEQEDPLLYEKAMEYNERALEKCTIDRGMFLTQRSQLALKLNQLSECIEYGEKALVEEPNNFEAYIQMGEAYSRMEMYHEALDSYESAINFCPYYVKPYIEQIRIFLQFDATDRAKEVVERFTATEVPSLWIKVFQAKVARLEGDLEGAKKLIAEVEAGLKDSEQNDVQEKDSVYHEKALIYYHSNEIDTGIEALKVALEIAPKCTRYHYFMGNLLWKKDDYEAAEAAFQKAHELEPKNTNILIQLGSVYMDHKRAKMAYETFQKVIELEPENTQVYGKLGEHYENLGQTKDAIEAYGKQLELDPSSYYYISRGLMYFRLGQFTEAEQDYLSAAEMDAENGYAYYNRARIYMAQQKYEEAILLYEKAIEVSGEHPAAIFYKYLARCYSRMGNVDKAVEVLQKAIDMKLGAVAAADFAGDICATHGYTQQALDYYKKYEQLTNNPLGAYREQTKIRYMQKAGNGPLNKTKRTMIRRELLQQHGKNPKDGELTICLAEIYYAEGKYAKAAELLKGLQSPNCGNYLRMKYARCLYRLNRRTEMLEVLKVVSENAREDYEDYMSRRDALIYLSEAAGMSGDLAAAKNHLQEAKECVVCDFCNESECYEILLMEGRILEEEGQKELALEKYKAASNICKNDMELFTLLNRQK